MFKFRRLADYSDGSSRVARFDPVTGDKFLADPETNEPKAWPTLGFTVVGELPKLDSIGMHYVAAAVAEGWMEWDNHQIEHKPGGSPTNPWSTTHTFHHADRIYMKLMFKEDGTWVPKTAVYQVVRQPDKTQDAEGNWTVDWTYDLKLVTVGG